MSTVDLGWLKGELRSERQLEESALKKKKMETCWKWLPAVIHDGRNAKMLHWQEEGHRKRVVGTGLLWRLFFVFSFFIF